MIGFQKGSKYVVVGKMRFVKENKQVMLMNNWPIQKYENSFVAQKPIAS